MPDLNTLPPQRLFKQWREGDAASGQAMAQRFSDWYYAVTACRLGDLHGRGPLQRSCTRFQQGIMGVQRPEELVDWAHRVLADEVQMAGGRIPGGDFANQLTGGRSPTEILHKVRKHLDRVDVSILAHAYDTSYPIERVQQETQAMGGMPVAVLRARYRLKQALRDHAGIALLEVPEEPNLDYAPLPLYEAGRMRSATEEASFEKWLLSNVGLCRDIAEFGVFALALRNGAFGELTRPEPVAPPPAPEPAAPAPVVEPAAPAPAASPAPAAPAAPAPVTGSADVFADPKKKGTSGMMLAGIGVIVGVLLLAAAVAAALALGFLG